jgi:hypothetical protein
MGHTWQSLGEQIDPPLNLRRNVILPDNIFEDLVIDGNFFEKVVGLIEPVV